MNTLLSSVWVAIASLRLLDTAAWLLSKDLTCKIDNLQFCGPGYFVVAVTPLRPGEKFVELCPLFFDLSPIPSGNAFAYGGFTDASMAGVMVHEWTHLVFKAKDVQYLCKSVQRFLGSRTIDNAGSYRCWVEVSYAGASDSLLERVFGD